MQKKIIFLIFIFVPLTLSASKNIYIYTRPDWWGPLFDLNNIVNCDDHRQPTVQLKQALEAQGFQVFHVSFLENLPDLYCLLTFDVPVAQQMEHLLKYSFERRLLFLWEPPSVISKNFDITYHQLFPYVYTWHDQLVDNKKYYKFYYPVLHPIIEGIVPFEEKKFCAIITANKQSAHLDELYSERRKIMNFFINNYPDDLDCYGRGGWPKEFPCFNECYKGPIIRKIDVLPQYKFCICYENIKDVPGYVTEKIFDCFRAGCVPIYWGASNITEYVPANCFIPRQHFASDQELYLYLKAMDKSTYEQYIKNIQQFLESPVTYLFSIPHFIHTVKEAIARLTLDH